MASARRAGPVLMIHGGTGGRPTAARARQIRRSLRTICERAYALLESRSAVEAVAFSVQLIEDDPLYNAGTGSVLQRDGRARMSASIMDGNYQGKLCPCPHHAVKHTEEMGRFAAALNIEQVRNPVLVAQALLDRSDRVLAGTLATKFARSIGMPAYDPITPARLRQWETRREGKTGTVGAVALDRNGRLAAATSTGGKGFEQPGRVSDSGTPAGNFASPQLAISCTGLGEEILDEGLAIKLAQRVADGLSLTQAFAKTFRESRRHQRHFGAIAVDGTGRTAWATTLPVLYAIARNAKRAIITF